MTDNPLVRKIFHKLFHLLFLLKRPMTLGVRILATNTAGEILLVKHTYVPGWYLPGGGIETGETALAAAKKELEEETGYVCTGEPVLVGVYYNRSASRRDHVLLYRALKITKARDFKPDREIAEVAFFAVEDLPENLTAGSSRRIIEHIGGGEIIEFW